MVWLRGGQAKWVGEGAGLVGQVDCARLILTLQCYGYVKVWGCSGVCFILWRVSGGVGMWGRAH